MAHRFFLVVVLVEVAARLDFADDFLALAEVFFFELLALADFTLFVTFAPDFTPDFVDFAADLDDARAAAVDFRAALRITSV